jgi:acyl-CoA synthetase (AMP-forming)/AMP-acid ligase II
MAENGAPPAHTLVDLLRRQADRYGDKVAFSFSYNGDDQDASRLTYRDLDLKARAIAARLQHQGAAGQRVLVFCRPGLGHVAGFFGCVYAGAIPVPVHERLAPRLASVVPDAQAGFALAAPETPAKLKTAVDDLVGVGDMPPVRWGLTDAPTGDADKWVAPDIDTDTTALVQYTSGTTRAPKGVVVTHRNLLHNVEAARTAWDGDEHAISVWWLPQHHDMGLIGGILEMLYIGCTTHLMSPAVFIKRPMRWLEAISRQRATYTAAPDFAYQRCVEHSSAEERALVDLSSLAVAMNGAEPVRAATLRNFADAFGPSGFRPETFLPVYGLAEATLLVSGGSDSPVPVVTYLDRSELGQDRVVDATPEEPTAVAVVSCGRPQGGQRIVIVNPETRRECGPDEVGEIWVAGSSIAQGYGGRPAETEYTFSAYLAGTGSDSFPGPFLRTGDLGFLRSGELFVTGRCKDLVMVGGSNYYPNDIEATVQDCHSALLSGRGAVFSVMPESGAAEELTVVQEVDGRVSEAEFRGIVDAIQTALAEHHLIQVHTVVLVEPMRIPTTSSGKIQRGQCRQQFLDGDLEAVAEWYASSPSDGDTALSSAFLKSFTKNRDPRAADGLAKLVKAAQQHHQPAEAEFFEAHSYAERR